VLDVVQNGAPFHLEFIVKEGYDFSRYASLRRSIP